MITHVIFSAITTFCLTLFAIIYLRPISIHIGLVDEPNSSRKQHEGLIPLIGGIAMLLGFGVGLLALNISLAHYRMMLVSVVIMSFFSVLDDFHELSHKARFVVQFFIAFVIAYFGHNVINYLGNFLFISQVNLGLLNLPFTIIAIMAVINAVNMMDGLDGLAGVVSFVQFIFLIILAWRVARYEDCYIIIIFVSSILAFLIFNFPYKKQRKHRIFMGDVGSALIGIMLSWFLITFSQTKPTAADPVTFLWIMALPFFDLISVVYRRIKNKKSPFCADREHLHHILCRSGLSVFSSVLIMLIISVIFGITGIIMSVYGVTESVMFLSLLVSFLGYIFIVNHVGLLVKFFQFVGSVNKRRIENEEL